MNVKLNGEADTADDGECLLMFLRSRFSEPHRLIVEHNGQITPPESWPGIRLRPDDKLEVMSIVGGG